MSIFQPGETLLHYRIVGKIGEGGMGHVYQAEDAKLGRMVALKFLPPDTIKDDKARRRLMQEARAASALNHPNIVTIHSIDEGDALGALADEAPVVLLLEDLHWADPSSVDLLRHLSQRIAGQRV